MFQHLTLGNGRLIDSAHLLQQILFISAVLEAVTFTFSSRATLKVKYQGIQRPLWRVQEISINADLKIFLNQTRYRTATS